MMYVQTTLCTGCGTCVEVCPQRAISLMGNVATINQALCDECETCVKVCPEGAILSVTEVAEEKVQVPVARPAPEPISVRAASPAPTPAPARVLPAVGAALAFAGRELIPRLGPYLLDLLDRRLSRSPGAARSGEPMAQGKGWGGRRLRRRRRGG